MGFNAEIRVNDEEKCFWCSNGITIHNEYFGGKEHKTLSREDVENFAAFCWQKIEETLEKMGNLTYAYKVNDKDEIHLMPCDGIEITSLSDNRINRYDKEYCSFIVIDDDWEFSGYQYGLTAALDILKSVDFTRDVVTYVGGY